MSKKNLFNGLNEGWGINPSKKDAKRIVLKNEIEKKIGPIIDDSFENMVKENDSQLLGNFSFKLDNDFLPKLSFLSSSQLKTLLVFYIATRHEIHWRCIWEDALNNNEAKRDVVSLLKVLTYTNGSLEEISKQPHKYVPSNIREDFWLSRLPWEGKNLIAIYQPKWVDSIWWEQKYIGIPTKIMDLYNYHLPLHNYDVSMHIIDRDIIKETFSNIKETVDMIDQQYKETTNDIHN